MWRKLIPQPRLIETKSGAVRPPEPIAVHGATLSDYAIGRMDQAVCRVFGLEGPRLVRAQSSTAAWLVLLAADIDTGAYELEVKPTGAVLRHSDNAGLAAGMATLAQALALAAGGEGAASDLPCVRIHDQAVFEWRGFMFDLARHFFPMESVQSFLDVAWLYKINRYHLHLTDDQGWRLPVDGYERLTAVGAYRSDQTSNDGRYGGFYDVDELRSLAADACALGVTLVPEIDLPGHGSAALAAYPELGCGGASRHVETRWGIFDAVICASSLAARRFIEACYQGVRDVFDTPYLHIGGDEVVEEPWRRCSRCSALEQPYQEIVRFMADTAISAGFRPVAWDEAAGLDLPVETIIVNWRGVENARIARNRGYEVVFAPQQARAYLDHKHLDSDLEPGRLGVCTVENSASFVPPTTTAEVVPPTAPAEAEGAEVETPGGGRIKAADNVLGGQANLWTEAIPYHRHAEYMGLVRLLAIAEGLWAGRPAHDRRDFYVDLELHRRLLSNAGHSVYRGPIT